MRGSSGDGYFVGFSLGACHMGWGGGGGREGACGSFLVAFKPVRAAHLSLHFPYVPLGASPPYPARSLNWMQMPFQFLLATFTLSLSLAIVLFLFFFFGTSDDLTLYFLQLKGSPKAPDLIKTEEWSKDDALS